MKSCVVQCGSTLISALLLLSLLGLAYASYRHGLSSPRAAENQAAYRLHQAAEALLARAANDDNRPGSLPCPDLLTRSSAMGNIPGDGKADLLTRNQCPANLGLLPWATLDLPAAHDLQGNTLWYFLAPGLTDDDSSQPLNSSRPTGLQFDGNTEIAALIFAPGPPQPGQRRPAFDPDQYLEGDVISDSNQQHYLRRTNSNDQVLAISRQTLQHVVGQRVAQQVRHCLQTHSKVRGTYPWPAALENSKAQGELNRFFGRLPLTQPSTGLADEITHTDDWLSRNRPPAPTTLSVNEQLAALDALNDALSWHESLYYNIAQSTQLISDAASLAQSRLASLWAGIDRAIANNRIARSEGTSLRSQGAFVLATLTSLIDALDELGLDALAWSSNSTNTQSGTKNISRQRLQAIQTDFLSALNRFEEQDSAAPRPLQQALVPDVIALRTSTVDLPDTLEIIIRHALTANSQAIQGQQQGSAAKQSLSSTQKIVPQPLPKSGNNTAIINAWALLNSDLDALKEANRQQLQSAYSSNAQAWPMTWASSHCRFLLPHTASWWQANQWQDDIFYQISATDPHLTGQLSSGRHQNLSLLVVAAGPPLAGQQRPSIKLTDYLEDEFADLSHHGSASEPSPRQDGCVTPARNTTCNDTLAF